MPWVVGHRGAASDFAEHTPAAIQRALDLGADAIECDVRLTADGEVVLFHDATTTRTASASLRVSKSTLAQLRSLDFGSWHDGTTNDDDASISFAQRTSLMTLFELFELLEAQPRPVGLLVETKHPSRNGKALEPYVARVFQHFGWNVARDRDAPPVAVMSFSQRALQRMHTCDEHVKTVWLTRPPLVVGRNGALPANADAVGPSIALLHRNPEWVRQQVQSGREVYVWTVDTDSDLALASELGVTAVITNRPGWAKEGLAGSV
jgi:glycerophosphoryl diester phosphodiesterase